MIIVNCSIDVVETETDPSINVWTASVQSEGGGDGEWCETFGSLSKLQAFVRGLKVATDIIGVPARMQEKYTPDAEAALMRL